MEKKKIEFSDICFFAGGLSIGILLTGKLYTSLRKDYNRIVDKHNKLVDFIKTHDFYEKQEDKNPEPKKNTEVSLTETYNDDIGKKVYIYNDRRGIEWKLYSNVKKEAY